MRLWWAFFGLPLVTLGCGGCDTGELGVNLSIRSGLPLKDCSKGGSCGGHDTFIQVVLDDGTTLSAASGYQVAQGKAELGNGLSYLAGEPCGAERPEFHLGYLFIRP